MNYFADLDDTLYPLNFGLANAVPHNIQGKGERRKSKYCKTKCENSVWFR